MEFVEGQLGPNYLCVSRRSPGPHEGSLCDIMASFGFDDSAIHISTNGINFRSFLPSDQVQHKHIVIDSKKHRRSFTVGFIPFATRQMCSACPNHSIPS